MRSINLLVVVAVVVTLGCGELFVGTESGDSAGANPGESQVKQNEPESQPAETERVVAEQGVGEKGRGYGGGLITEAASQYWGVRERIVFQVQIPKNMQLYEATNGRKPKSHDEFMQAIVVEGGIGELPTLPEGHRYVYDPEKGELMVERPKP